MDKDSEVWSKDLASYLAHAGGSSGGVGAGDAGGGAAGGVASSGGVKAGWPLESNPPRLEQPGPGYTALPGCVWSSRGCMVRLISWLPVPLTPPWPCQMFSPGCWFTFSGIQPFSDYPVARPATCSPRAWRTPPPWRYQNSLMSATASSSDLSSDRSQSTLDLERSCLSEIERRSLVMPDRVFSYPSKIPPYIWQHIHIQDRGSVPRLLAVSKRPAGFVQFIYYGVRHA